MTAYYNENEPYAAQWLRNLIAAGHIAPGDVDERSIKDVKPDDLRGYAQCHFFAGIGGWSLALRIAGWDDARPVWTGSCPCQPFSLAGKRKGEADDRHLWPEFSRLIAERRPPTIFGEQVANAPDWLRGVRSDLEAVDYAVGCMPIEAASAGADHFRDRYWFVADSDEQRQGVGQLQRSGGLSGPGRDTQDHIGPLAYGDSTELRQQSGRGSGAHGPGQGASRENSSQDHLRDVVDATRLGWGEGWTESEFRRRGFTAAVASIDGRQFVECPDGKWRGLPPPGVRWLGTRIPARVAKLRAIGNAIDWRPAAEFIRSYAECRA